MARVFRAPRWTVVRKPKEAAVRTTEGGPGRSEPVCETALRRLGDYRCMRLGAYCAQRIDAGPGIAPSDGRNRSCADRWGRWRARLAGWNRLAVSCARPGLKKAKVLAKLREVRSWLKQHSGTSPRAVVRYLNSTLPNWAEYYRHVSSSRVYAYFDHRLFRMLWSWARRRHTKRK